MITFKIELNWTLALSNVTELGQNTWIAEKALPTGETETHTEPGID